jgi:hypothetical protein
MLTTTLVADVVSDFDHPRRISRNDPGRVISGEAAPAGVLGGCGRSAWARR